MSDPTDRRREFRMKGQFEVLYASFREEGAGFIKDISYRGALLEEASPLPKIGSNLLLRVAPEIGRPFELHARVVRHTERGFGVTFDTIDPEVRGLVDNVAALLSVGDRSTAAERTLDHPRREALSGGEATGAGHATEPSDPEPERRRSPRVEVRFDSLVCQGREEAAGVLADLSDTGSLVRDTSLQPPVGTRLRLHALVPGNPKPIVFFGVVVRHVEGGFAIEFEKSNPELRRLLDDPAGFLPAGH